MEFLQGLFSLDILYSEYTENVFQTNEERVNTQIVQLETFHSFQLHPSAEKIFKFIIYQLNRSTKIKDRLFQSV